MRDEKHRDLVVILDLPAKAFRVEALRLLHVIDAQKDRADVRIHFAPPQYIFRALTQLVVSRLRACDVRSERLECLPRALRRVELRDLLVALFLTGEEQL